MEEAPTMEPGTLVAYVSAGGATEAYARVIADVLRSRGHTVDMVDLRRQRVRDLSPYANVVIGTGVRFSMVYRRGKRFLRRRDLKGKRVALYLSSGMAVEDPEKARVRYLDPLVRRHGLSPVMYAAFPGKMFGKEGTLEDQTDTEAVRQWAGELAARLGTARTSTWMALR